MSKKPISSEPLKREIVIKQIVDLVPYLKNARTHDDHQVHLIANSIREFGFNNPILLDAKSRMQVAMHPDVSELVFRFGRVHHYVDYSQFKKTMLVLKPNVVIPKGIDNYGMALKKVQVEDDNDERDSGKDR